MVISVQARRHSGAALLVALTTGVLLGAVLNRRPYITAVTTPTFEYNMAIVLKVYDDWGAGKLNGPGQDIMLAEDFTTDVITDASALMKNTDGYKVYHGLSEMAAWLDFLLEISFPDFKVIALSPGSGPDKVLVEVSYTPTVKATGKTGSLMTDVQEWTVAGGKVSGTKFYWGSPASVDELFSSDTAPTFEANKAIVLKVFGDWGAGKLNGPGQDVALAEDFTTDVTTDAYAPMKNTYGYKVYHGLSEAAAWLDFLLEISFPDFKVISLSPGSGPDKVLVEVSYTPTVKATGKTGSLVTDMHEWTMAGGKVSKIKFYWGSPASVDALFL